MPHDYINDLITRDALQCALQGAPALLPPGTSKIDRDWFRGDLSESLHQLGKRYVRWDYSELMYYEEIERFKDGILKSRHQNTLTPGVLTLGITQLCIGTYLKGLWLAGDPVKMPLLPPVNRALVDYLQIPAIKIHALDTRPELSKVMDEITRRAIDEGYRTGTIWEAESGWREKSWYL